MQLAPGDMDMRSAVGNEVHEMVVDVVANIIGRARLARRGGRGVLLLGVLRRGSVTVGLPGVDVIVGGVLRRWKETYVDRTGRRYHDGLAATAPSFAAHTRRGWSVGMRVGWRL